MAVLADPLPAERAGGAAPSQLLERRQALAAALSDPSQLALQGGRFEQVDGIRTVRFGAASPRGTAMVHFHGGGFRQGQPDMIAGYAAALAKIAGIEVCCPAYRLAPEHPFPAALNDGMRVIAAMRAEGVERIILAGDSAGGGLAAGLAQICAVKGIAVDALVLHSPWLDLTASNATYRANQASDPLFSHAAATEAAELYLQGHPAEDRFASPLFADTSCFPPTFISVGGTEVLLGDALAFHERLLGAGRSAELCAVEVMDHVAVTRGIDLPGARHVMAKTLEFVARYS